MKIYIDIKGGIRVNVGGMTVEWADKWGNHKGEVVAFGRTAETGGTEASRLRMVYTVKCDDGSVRELRPHELRDLIGDKVQPISPAAHNQRVAAVNSRWGGRGPSKVVRVDEDAAALLAGVPERDRRTVASEAIRAAVAAYRAK